MLRRPLYRDWIFWLWGLMTFVGIKSTLDYYPDGIRTGFDRMAFTIDVAIVLGVNTLLFLLLPAGIRRAVRRGRARRKAARASA